MKQPGVRLLYAVLCAALWSGPASANPQLAAFPGARANMEITQPRMVRGTRFPYDHEITVALPASYHAAPDRKYPVLWVLDAPLMLRTVVGILDTLVIGNHAPEMIVVGVGSRSEDGLAGIGRRIIDFSPPGPDYYPPGDAGKAWSALAPLPEFPHRADDFLAYLVDELRPQLAATYRLSGEHALFGHSAGGMFAAYALFKRPGAFDKMIIGSPYLDGVRGAVFSAEADYSARNEDLPVALFLGAGEREIDEYFLAVSGIVSSMTRFSETLRLRRYPSLRLDTRIYAGEDHYTVVPRIVGEGIRQLWRDEAALLPSSWPVPGK
ncbi:MAG: alpha/beta hydrolase [Lysobacterales bacterium]|jgi:predicted alpha/beta superfamily hydrolase|nr:MAG: alpha/beta hydrolase [Xanthomonadales bacterium]